jgi:hypothetical protein
MDSDDPALGSAQRLRQHGQRHGWGLMPALPRALQALAHEAVVTEEGPHPTVKVEPTAQQDTGVILGGRAIHSGPERFPADNHGQRQSLFDLHRSLPPQVTILPDLALGAGGRGKAAAGPVQPRGVDARSVGAEGRTGRVKKPDSVRG